MQLLPIDHYDIIVQIEGDFEFIVNDKTIPINCPMVHGLRHENIVVKQNYYVHAFGISFTPWGFHFFYRASMAELTDRVVKLSKCIHELNDAIMKNIYLDINGMISTVEDFFLNNLQNYKNININYDLIRSYIYHDLTVAEFCERNQIQRRQFERKFKEVVGASPKDYKRIMQFEDASRSLL